MTDRVRSLRYVTADVFTSAVFTGNPLAMVFNAEGLPTETLQNIAKEFGYSETVFVFDAESEAHTRRVRIFTPGAELPFAGHPTIGTAHVLVATGELSVAGVGAGASSVGRDEVTVVLGEGVGPVPVRVTLSNGVPVHARLTTAMLPDERDDVPGIAELARVLSLSESDFIGGDYAPAGVSCGIPFLIVPLKTVSAVSRARVQMDEFDRVLRGRWASEPLVFAMQGGDGGGAAADASLPEHVRGCDIRARVFVPSLAVPEDPATGSAGACLAGYLARRTPRQGSLRWEVAQGIEMGRPSRLTIEAEKSGGSITAIHVGGNSVIVTTGHMSVPA